MQRNEGRRGEVVQKGTASLAEEGSKRQMLDHESTETRNGLIMRPREWDDVGRNRGKLPGNAQHRFCSKLSTELGKLTERCR